MNLLHISLVLALYLLYVWFLFDSCLILVCFLFGPYRVRHLVLYQYRILKRRFLMTNDLFNDPFNDFPFQ